MAAHMPSPASRRRLRAVLAREDGWAATAIILPAMIVFVLAAIQVACWFLGNDVAQSAAVSAYNQSRSYQSIDAAGVQAGNEIIAANGELLASPSVQVSRTADTVTVTVTGRPMSIIPGLNLPPITRTVTGPVERWVPK